MNQPATFAEHHYRAKDLAALWGLSPTAIRRLFRDEPGVLRYARPKKGHQRDYASLRIPASVAERVYRRCLLPDPHQPKQNQPRHAPSTLPSDLRPRFRLPKPSALPRQSASAEPPQKPNNVAP